MPLCLHLYSWQADEGLNSGRNNGTIQMIWEQISTTTESVFILLEVPVVLRSFEHENKCRRSENLGNDVKQQAKSEKHLGLI